MIRWSRRAAMGAMAAAGALAGAPGVAAPIKANNRQRLWYRQPAQKWTEALPVGNGRIGAMIFGGVASERLQLNEDTLWSGGPYSPVNPKARGSIDRVRKLVFDRKYRDAEKLINSDLLAIPSKQAAYQSLGDLTIRMDGIDPAQANGYERSLDLDAAVAETVFTVGGVRYRRRVVASPGDQVIAVHLSADKPGRIGCTLSFTSPEKDWQVAVEGDDTLVLNGRNDPHDKIAGALRYEARLSATTRGGRVTRGDRSLVVTGADEVTLLIAMATSFKRFDDVTGDPAPLNRATIAKARGRSFTTIADASTAEHRRLFRRVSLDLGNSAAVDLPTDERVARSESLDDPALAALYFDYGRYLLICSSRPGSQPANLQGIWNDSPNPPWGSKYTININTEMNYWPAELVNLPECVEPLVQLVRDLAVTGERTARDMYGARGWVAHHNTDLWRATAPIDGAPWGMWPTGGAWLCTHLWEHYQYAPDRAYLESIYPILRGAALFFLDTLQVDPVSGALVTNPSISPENQHPFGGAIIAGPTMDNQILRDLFDQTVAAAGILNTDAELAGQIRTTRARLLPDKIGAQGQLQEWPEDWDAKAPEMDHRHVSHLYGLYPSRQIDVERTPALAAAVKKSLEIRGDRATGWATAWRINLWARLRDGDRAHSILRFLLGPERTYPNLFDAHPPFQIDGNFGGTSGVCEMLVQADEKTIRLLPALPRAWPTGSVSGLRLMGGCLLDLSWRGGKLESATIRGGVTGPREVRLGNGKRAITLAPGKRTRLRARDFA